jgi:hypothetical protein
MECIRNQCERTSSFALFANAFVFVFVFVVVVRLLLLLLLLFARRSPLLFAVGDVRDVRDAHDRYQ